MTALRKQDIKILIVEDEGIEALDMQHRLVKLGYRAPEIAFSGEEAIQKAEEIRPDLALVDIMLHGAIDGVAAAKQILGRMGIPVIYITAYADNDTVQRAKATDPYGYIVKPFNERDLDIAIDMALYKHTMERKLRESEEWLSTTLRSIGDAVIATDRNGLVRFINPVAEHLTGWSQADAVGHKLTEVFRIIDKDTRRTVENPAARVMLEGRMVGLANHTLLIARDGREIPIDDSAAPIKDDQGDITGVILVFRDVTEREKAETALRKAYEDLERRVLERTADLTQEIEQRKMAEDQLQEKNIELEHACLAKDRFLANMSHELRTPLNAIIGFTGTLLMRLPGPLTAEQESQLKNIATSAKHLLLLINDLLDLAKIESGKVELNPEPVSCQSVLKEITETLRPMADSKRLQLTSRAPEQDLIVCTDHRVLNQILLNLTYNAIKFTDKGEVQVCLRSVDCNGGARVEFSVIDTGIGIKPEDQERIFHAFTQVDQSGVHRHEGAGLGLHLSRKLAELLGGRIIMQSEYGKGSEFTLALDACSAPVSADIIA